VGTIPREDPLGSVRAVRVRAVDGSAGDGEVGSVSRPALGLVEPWQVTSAEFDCEQGSAARRRRRGGHLKRGGCHPREADHGRARRDVLALADHGRGVEAGRPDLRPRRHQTLILRRLTRPAGGGEGREFAARPPSPRSPAAAASASAGRGRTHRLALRNLLLIRVRLSWSDGQAARARVLGA
jgi:hypothetical protein